MDIFDNFPLMNAYSVNLDWIIRKMHDLEEYVGKYTAINNVTYIGAWSIDKSYTRYSIVTTKGNTYISKTPVPDGVEITNDDYWAVLFTKDPVLQELLESVKNINAKIVDVEAEIVRVAGLQAFINVRKLGDIGGDIGALLNSVDIGGKTIYFPPGDYTFATAAMLSDNVTLLLDHATFKGVRIFNVAGKSNVHIIGGGVFAGENADAAGMFFNGCSNVTVDGDFQITGFSSKNSIGFEFVNSNNITLRGFRTSDSKLALLVDCNHAEICNMIARFTLNAYYAISVTRVTDAAYSNIRIHDNYINGGDVLSLAAINVSIDKDGTYNPTDGNYARNSDISVYNNTIEHCALQCDGIDLLYAHGVSCYGNKIRYCLEGIAVLSEQVTISDNYIALCRGAGVAFGDPSLGSGGVTYSGITMCNNTIIANGSGADAIYKQERANIMFKNPAGVTVSTVYISTCNISGADYGVWTDGNIDNIVFANSFVYGSVSSFKTTAPTKISFNGCPVQNYAGFVTPPENKTISTVNTFSTPIQILLTNGNTSQITVYINDTPALIVPPNATASYVLNPAHSTKLSTSDNIAWSWIRI